MRLAILVVCGVCLLLVVVVMVVTYDDFGL